jgi:hypothetical protein
MPAGSYMVVSGQSLVAAVKPVLTYFGLTVTPNGDNCCALLSNVPAGQLRIRWPWERPQISTDL